MGILNISPDSFHDGGKFIEQKKMLQHAERMLEQGADFIDLGAVSSRPGARSISMQTEWKRLGPALDALTGTFPGVPISVDTCRSEVARRAIDRGAAMINDISAGTADRDMFEVIGRSRIPILIMHMQGTPDTMQMNPRYRDVVREVYTFLGNKTVQLAAEGITDVLVDPGFGFGKSVEHNYELLKGLSLFRTIGKPVAVGVSRKSMINKVINTRPAGALNGTTALHAWALQNGARLLRVHDVREAAQAILLWKAMSDPAGAHLPR